MSATVHWQPDGTPVSLQFDDIYRPGGAGALAQARQVFLGGCGLLPPHAAWARQPVWQILETGFGLGLNFLAAWHAWRQDPARPARLFYSAVEAHVPAAADILRSAAPFAELAPLAAQLAARWRGLLPGVHRLQFEQGALQLTLAAGDAQPMLNELSGRFDSVFLDGFSPHKNPHMWTPEVLRAAACMARPGARLATWCVAGVVRERLAQCGFTVERVPGLAPKRHALLGTLVIPAQAGIQTAHPPSGDNHGPPDSLSFPRRRELRGNDDGNTCLIIGAGLAGASLAWSLAARGWQVTVLARGSQPADGASGLPAGVTAPHVSPDDRPISRLTRAGVAATFERARALLLREGSDFAECGVLERHESGKRQTPQSWQDALENEAARPLSTPASAQQCRQAGLAADDEHAALWHARAGWLRPAALVRAMLAAPGVRFIGGAQVARIAAHAGGWQALDAAGAVLAQADLACLAAGYGTLALLTASAPQNAAAAWPLHPLRGQLAFGPAPAAAAALPPFPVNGNGNFTGPLPDDGQGAIWVSGATFVRDDTSTAPRAAEHAANFQRLAELLPPAAALLAPQWDDGRASAWAGVRCTIPDRLPMTGPLPLADTGAAQPPLVLTGLGSRGLTLAVLAAEIAAAWLHAEPLPVERSLAHALRASRWSEKTAKSASHPHRRAHPPGGPVALNPSKAAIAAMQAARAGELETVTLEQIRAEIRAAQKDA